MKFFKSSLEDFEAMLADRVVDKRITLSEIESERDSFMYENPDFRYSLDAIAEYMEWVGWDIIGE